MYYGIICELKNIRKHPDADRIQLATVYGNQVVIDIGRQDGDLGVFFPSDGQLSEEFCKDNDLISYIDPDTGEKKGGYFDHKRRVRAQKFRGEKSDGFWIPIESLSFTGINISKLKIGDQISEINNIPICNKYITSSTKNIKDPNSKKSKKRKIKKHYVMFKEHVDTNQFAYNVDKICKHLQGGLVTITEKCHGSSGRSSFSKITYDLPLWKHKINKRIKLFKNKEDWKYIAGTRRVVLDRNDGLDQFYGTNEFRMVHHNKFVNNLHKGETIYYEIVGYVGQDKTIMPSCDNKKLKDKKFIKQYGDTTTFKYGCIEGQSDIYVYRITLTNEDGYSIEYPWNVMVQRCRELGVKHVPLLIEPFILTGEWCKPENLTQVMEDLYDGPSTIDHSHIREGVVIRIDLHNEFQAYKHKNFEFKVLEGIIKDRGDIDIEEAQDYVLVEE